VRKDDEGEVLEASKIGKSEREEKANRSAWIYCRI